MGCELSWGFRRPNFCVPHGPAWCWLDADLDADCSRHPCGVVSKMRTPNSHGLTLYFLIQINMLKYPQFYSIPLCPCDICMNGWLWHINSHRKKLTPFFATFRQWPLGARDQLLWEFEAINHEATLEVHASQKVRALSVLLRSASHSFLENRVVIYMALDWKTGMNSIIHDRKRMINHWLQLVLVPYFQTKPLIHAVDLQCNTATSPMFESM